jgi:hypothetical protein
MMGLEEFHLEGLMARLKLGKNLVSGIRMFYQVQLHCQRKRNDETFVGTETDPIKKSKAFMIMCKKINI